MNRPAFQFYPKDWRNNLKLRRCSEGARGAWIDIMCALHDSEEYGVVRFPLAELAASAGVKLKSARELVDKGVLKGGDRGAPAYVYTPRHAGKDLASITLLEETTEPIWYSSRMVRDEYLRARRGESTRFSTDRQPGGKPPPKPPPDDPPTRREGERQGDGPAVCSLQFAENPPSEKRFPGGGGTPDSAASRGAAALEELRTRPLTVAEAKVGGGEDTPAAILASVLKANGLRGNAFHPLVVEWAREGVTVERLKGAITRARQRPGKESGTFGPEYLDPILHDTSKPAAEVQQERVAQAAAKGVEKANRVIEEQRRAKERKAPPPEGFFDSLPKKAAAA